MRSALHMYPRSHRTRCKHAHQHLHNDPHKHLHNDSHVDTLTCVQNASLTKFRRITRSS
jgi:hypothetical protein